MKRTTTRTEITVEKRQRITVRPDRTRVAVCEQCTREVVMLSPEAAAALFETTARVIFRLIEAGELHFLETVGGGLLVCRNSLESASATDSTQIAMIEKPQT
jgi:hypothetical protein